ncbi:MAG: tellurium resistance protein TehB [SAR324 cluster bacterium]|uniref:Tellurium resistance protein TehB n=1 Tax=SAR324 cluster bacterium TaxID=2024889 RepID=A0A2A4SRG5_9DELT|nr:MAG: tellurium resistance protein TehB [SAR324 cluster bacterium]
MQEDQIKWDQRYREGIFSSDPALILTRFLPMAKSGKALDIAAGSGRNSLYLFQQGFEVDSWDISDVGLAQLKKQEPGIQTRQVDLDRSYLRENQYNLVVNINYLNRRLFPQIKEALKPEGLLIFRTFLEGDPGSGYSPSSNKEYYLKKNELLHAFLSMDILFYQEEILVQSNGTQRSIASLVARKK